MTNPRDSKGEHNKRNVNMSNSKEQEEVPDLWGQHS
jgi:hypothetical protein